MKAQAHERVHYPPPHNSSCDDSDELMHHDRETSRDAHRKTSIAAIAQSRKVGGWREGTLDRAHCRRATDSASLTATYELPVRPLTSQGGNSTA